MCCNYNRTLTEKLKRSKKQKMVVWKVLCKMPNGTYQTPYKKTIVKRKDWLLPSRARKNYDRFTHTQPISSGVIHCYRTRAKARYMADLKVDQMVIRCVAYRSDFVAAGMYNDLCFKKLYIP